MSRSSASVLWSGFFLLLMGLAVYLPVFWRVPLTRAEGMYALIPQEMLQSGHWLLSTLNGAPYLDKPPLLYWLNMLAYKVLGFSEMAARIPTLACTLGEIWLTYLIGRRLFTQRAAWLGGFVLLSSLGFFAHHLQILTDHLITLSLLASLYCLLRWQEEEDPRWSGGFYLALAGGFLSKGFIGLAFPLIISALYLWPRDRKSLYRLWFNDWALCLAGLMVAWFAVMEYHHPGFLRHQIFNEQIMRFLGRREPPDINPFSVKEFWIFLVIWLLPWTLLLPQALYRFWGEIRSRSGGMEQGSLLLIWAGVILGFFTLSSSRIEYYSLPALPALALVLGWRLDRILDASLDRSLIWPLLLMGVLGLGLLFLLPLLEEICGANRREFIGMFQLIRPLARDASYWIPGVTLLGVLAGWRYPRAAAGCYGALALMLCYFTFQTLMVLSPHLSDKIPGEFVRRQAGPQDLVVMESIEEFEYGASLAYYSGRRVLMVQRQGLPQFPLPVAPPANYIISPERLKELWTGPGKVFVLVDDATPAEAYLESGTPALKISGKRLLVNHP